jgi:hypothetical protein
MFWIVTEFLFAIIVVAAPKVHRVIILTHGANEFPIGRGRPQDPL